MKENVKTPPGKAQKAKRIIDTLTGPWEKRNLPKIAAKLPQWVLPDHLTLMGIGSAFLITAGYVLTWNSRWWLWLANFGIFLHWLADSLDGTLARVRRQERERYGYFVDHICDAITILAICIGLGASPLMDMRTALFLAIAYYLLNIYVHIAAYTEGVFRLSYAWMGPTEGRIFLFTVNIVVLFWNPVVFYYKGSPAKALDLLAIFVGLVLLAVFSVSSMRDALRLDRMDRAGWDKK